MKVKLVDGTEFDALGVHGRNIIMQGTQRDVLTFLFDPEVVSVANVLDSFTADNCTEIRIEDNEGHLYVHENYTIRAGAGIEPKSNHTGGSSSEDGDVVFVKMAQTTYAERTLENHDEAIKDIITAILEG